VTDKEIDAKIAEVRSDLERANAASNGQVGSFEAFMQQMGMDEKKLRESLRQSLAVEKILRKRGFDKPSDAELKKIYKENKDKLEKPASMRARHILVKVEPDADEKAWKKARAEAARLRALAVEEDADFAALAREHSRDSASASNGGDLGYFTRGHMVEAFEEASFALEEGEVSRPVRTRFGWHIIKAIDHRKADVPSFEKIAPQLRKQAESQALQAALKKYMMELRDQAKIQIHRENLEQ
jgi:parvulin-like peptidyl-prolyl isomerase